MRARALSGRRSQRSQYGACNVGERHLLETARSLWAWAQVRVSARIERHGGPAHAGLCLGENWYRMVPSSVRRCWKTAGHGFGELSRSPRQVENSAGSTRRTSLIESPAAGGRTSSTLRRQLGVRGCTWGWMMFAPRYRHRYNEGLYRCVSVDLGPPGTLCNAPGTSAPRQQHHHTDGNPGRRGAAQALEQGGPPIGSRPPGVTPAGSTSLALIRRNGNDEYVTMVLASIISGAGANKTMDGWPACGPLQLLGALMSGDIELLEYAYLILIHRYSLMTDSGGAGEFRGGSGTRIEIELLDHAMTVVEVARADNCRRRAPRARTTSCSNRSWPIDSPQERR